MLFDIIMGGGGFVRGVTDLIIRNFIEGVFRAHSGIMDFLFAWLSLVFICELGN